MGNQAAPRSVPVLVWFQLLRGMLVLVRPVLARVLMVVYVVTVGMFVLVRMNVLVVMAVHVSMFMAMSCPIAMGVLVSMGVRVFVLMAMLVFSFHVITSRPKMPVR